MSSSNTIIIFTISILSIPATTFSSITASSTHTDPNTEPDSCSGRRIYVRTLPARFNLDLLSNCSAYYPLYDDFCPYLANHGLGQPTHNKSLSWYRTDPTMLELIFHRRILEYPCLVPRAADSDAVFIPYYAGIDALRYLYGPESNLSALHGIELYHFLKHNDDDNDGGDGGGGGVIWGRNWGNDHFMVMAGPAWDYSQPRDVEERVWGTSLLDLPEFYNVSVLTLESRAWPWQEHAVPHPTSFHPQSLAALENWVMRVRRSRRSTLMVFAGGGATGTGTGTPNIRRSIREECVKNNETRDGRYGKICEIVDCSNGVCEHDPIRFMKPMLQASFCLQPPGDTPTRRSTFDGIIAGCIPVFFEDQSARAQYGWHLREEEFHAFSVTVAKEDVVFKGLSIVDVLMGIPRGEVRRMRENVMELIPRVMYRKHGSSLGLRTKKDAFDIAIDGVLGRIRDRVKELEVSSQ
ncbi:hypothetical protein Droror1_Dr00018604 [Drosera rotundifolia]